MSASQVLGQSDFISSSSVVNASTLSNDAEQVASDGTHLIVADGSNNRVLIWNSIPTTNGQPADVVLGQPDFVSNTANNGGRSAKTLSKPEGVFLDSGRLFVADTDNNNRVLIWNSIPTQNQQPADVEIGQVGFTNTDTNGNRGPGVGHPQANTLFLPNSLFVYQGKLFIGDSGNRRILIYNSIPQVNGASADIVVGQTNMTSANTTVDAIHIGGSDPRSINIYNGKLIATDGTGNKRVLIWNNIPTTNGQPADVVLGQPDFTTNSASSISCSSATTSLATWVNNGRLMIGGVDSRVLIYNTIPTSNNTSADIILGQPDCNSSTANNGGISNKSLNNRIRGIMQLGQKLFVSDSANNRILIFNNITSNPGLTLDNSPQTQSSGLTRLTGTATTNNIYSISSVQYSVNGGGLSGATATSGYYDSTHTGFYFDFDPTSNQPRDSNNNLIDGYTIQVKSTNTNTDVTDNLFYFQPFNLNSPADNTNSTSSYPSFDFSVSKQRTNLKNNLSKYQIQIRKGDGSSNAPWTTLIDNIPVDFSTVQTNSDNLKSSDYQSKDPNNGNGVYETDKLTANYSNDSAQVSISSKITQLSGTYQWKVTAVDKTGHTQDSDTRNIKVNNVNQSTNSTPTGYFPLAILNISGVGNPFISTTNPSIIKDTYNLNSLNPIFFGIASVNAKVTLTLTDQSCPSASSGSSMTTDCIKTYSTTSNPESRFGINVPIGDLTWNKKYTADLSVAYNQDYNELPQFTLSTAGYSTTSTSTQKTSSTDSIQQSASPTIAPTPQPIPIPQPIGGQQLIPKKKCFLFFCY